jgi:hypothetical protein
MRFLEQEAVMTLVTVKASVPRHVAAARTHRKGAATAAINSDARRWQRLMYRESVDNPLYLVQMQQPLAPFEGYDRSPYEWQPPEEERPKSDGGGVRWAHCAQYVTLPRGPRACRQAPAPVRLQSSN